MDQQPLEVDDNVPTASHADRSGKVTKCKQGILLTEYLSKKRHYLQKEMKQLSTDVENAGEYQKEFEQFFKNNVQEETKGKELKSARKKVKSKLLLNQSKRKNRRYIVKLMRTNPVKYA